MLSCLGVLLTLKGLPSEGQPIPGDSKGLACKHAVCIQTNQSRAYARSYLTPEPLFSLSSPKGQEPDNRDSSQAHSPPRLSRLAHPKPVYLPWLFPTTPTTTKAPAHVLPGSLCLLTSPGAPMWAAPPLRTGSSRNCLFNGSCFLICWAHQTSIEIKSAF